jgi:hypothetical protein
MTATTVTLSLWGVKDIRKAAFKLSGVQGERVTQEMTVVTACRLLMMCMDIPGGPELIYDITRAIEANNDTDIRDMMAVSIDRKVSV